MCRNSYAICKKCVTVKLLSGIGGSGGGDAGFFVAFDGIVDAQIATGMTNDQVRELILSTNELAAVDASLSSESAAAATTAIEVHPQPPHHHQQTSLLAYDDDGNQIEDKNYRG